MTTTVLLGTATPGGGFPVYGAAFVEGVARIDPGLEIEAINTKNVMQQQALTAQQIVGALAELQYIGLRRSGDALTA